MRYDYRRGEFEGRNRQLPADLNQSAPYSTNEKSRQSFEQTPSGTPPSCYDVRSVYDSRPVNTYDYHITQSGDFTAATVQVVEFTVPEGYVSVLRSVEVWFEPTPAGTDRSRASFSVRLNGGDVPNNTGILIGSGTDQPIPMFVLGDEFNRVGLRIVLDSAYSGTAFVHFYGNFILKSGRAYPFEIANLVADANCKPGTVVAPRAPPPPAPVASRPVVRAPAMPVVTASAPAPIRSDIPPFRITWRKAFTQGLGARDTSFRFLIPGTDSRDLSIEEIRQYFKFLDAQVTKRGDRILWENLLRDIGVR